MTARRLDPVALTHAHQDHIGGLTAVLQNFQAGIFACRGVEAGTSRKQEFDDAEMSRGKSG